MNSLNEAACAQSADKTLMVIGSRTLTYGDQWGRLRALQEWVTGNDLSGETPVLLAVTDELEQASLLLALIALGKPPLIIDPGSTATEAAVILNGATFTGVICETALKNDWGLDSQPGPLLEVRTGDGPKGVFGALLKKRTAASESQSWPAFVETDPQPLAVGAEGDSLAYVMFTSGTTSVPKGVEITRAALESQVMVLARQYGICVNSRILNVLPLHHVDGLVQGPVLAWSTGACVYRPLEFSTQHLQPFMDCIERNRITHLVAVPTMLSLLNRLGKEWKDNFQSPQFRMIVSCAGHLELPLWETLEEEFGVPVVNMYGLTETVTSAVISGHDGDTRRVGTLGKPVNCRVRIIGDSGDDVDPGEAGELLIASEQLMRGYHNDAQATAEVLRGEWLHTGDLCRLLDSGHIQLVGRKKNQIINGGRNISPEEVATCLNQHPGVVESIVFGQPDEDWGEVVAAVVVGGREGISEQELTEWCRAALSGYKVPRHIMVTDRLEKGPSGKVRVEAARSLFQENLAARHAQGGTNGDLESTVIRLVVETFRLPPSAVNAQSGIENTPGWDSLGHLSLLLAVEEAFGMKFTAREIMQVDSVARLVELCSAKEAK